MDTKRQYSRCDENEYLYLHAAVFTLITFIKQCEMAQAVPGSEQGFGSIHSFNNLFKKQTKGETC